MTVDAELKAKWVAALRSGKYNQARECLREIYRGNESFCCLGVLLDVQGATWLSVDQPIIDGVPANHRKGGWAAEEFSGGLSFEAQEKLSEMNDRGSSFFEIASFIEREL